MGARFIRGCELAHSSTSCAGMMRLCGLGRSFMRHGLCELGIVSCGFIIQSLLHALT